MPPLTETSPESLVFEQAVNKSIDAIDPEQIQHFNNLQRVERKAFEDLRNDEQVVLKPADKGGVVVIQSTTEYRKECLRLLGEEKHYRRLQEDPTPQLQNVIKNMTEEAEVCGWISKNEADYLVNTEPSIP